MVHDKEGDVLMKGLCSTDKFLRAILNKETGLLPPKGLLSHVGVIENPNYHKLIFLTDMAVIPAPEFRQKVKMTGFVTGVDKSFGISKPKVAFIAASEQMLDSMPACIEGAMLAKMCDRGQIPGCIGDGPLALDVAIDEEAVQIKKLVSPVAGDADCLVFPNIESANVFWKTNSKLCNGVKQAGMLVGTTVPCILASRADSADTKLNSIAEAVMFVKQKIPLPEQVSGWNIRAMVSAQFAEECLRVAGKAGTFPCTGVREEHPAFPVREIPYQG